MKNSLEKWLSRKENRQLLFFVIGMVMLYFYVRKRGKETSNGYKQVSTYTDDTPVNPGGNPPPPKTADGAIGVFEITDSDRTFTFNRTPEFELSFTGGNIFDATPGLDTSGPINKLGGWNVFYMIGYYVFENANGSYNKMQGVYLPDGPFTLKQFVCNPAKIPDLNAFKAGINGWGSNGVNEENGRMSQITLSINSKVKQGNGIAPAWLKPSRKLIYPSVLVNKDWSPYHKFLCSGYMNKGDAPKKYQDIGVTPPIDMSITTPQPQTWHTIKRGDSSPISEQELWDIGTHWMDRMDGDFRAYVTDEVPENMQNTDPDIYGKMQKLYAGAFNVLKNKGVTNKRNTGLYGPYGADDFTGLLAGNLLYGSRSDFEKSLTTHIFKGHGINGFEPDDHQYYTRGHVDVRNINAKYYFWNNEFFLPYEFLYLNERVKIGTKTYGGQDRESNVTVFTMAKVESFVMNGNGDKINIEETSTGEIIPFAGGEIHTRMNLQPPPAWDEMLTCGFWAGLILNGTAFWDAPGSKVGQDPSKIHWWSDQQIKWRPTGGNWEDYVSGQNGAPVNDSTGMMHSLYAPQIDAAAAGMEALWPARDRVQVLKHCRYSSSRGSYIPVPGSSGLHLNGFGALNTNLFVVKDLVDGILAISLEGSGSAGDFLVYYNGFLSPHEYEDDVILTRENGQSVNLGRVYGRQTVVKSL